MDNGQKELNDITYYLKLNFVEKPGGEVDPGSWSPLAQTGDFIFSILPFLLLILIFVAAIIFIYKKNSTLFNLTKEYILLKGRLAISNNKLMCVIALFISAIILASIISITTIAHADEQYFQWNSKDVTVYVDPVTGDISSEDIIMEFPYQQGVFDNWGFTADVFGDDFMSCHWNLKFNDDIVYDENWIPVQSGEVGCYQFDDGILRMNINLSGLDPNFTKSFIGQAPIMGFVTFIDKSYLREEIHDAYYLGFDITLFDVADQEKFDAFCDEYGWTVGDLEEPTLDAAIGDDPESYIYCYKNVGQPNVPVEGFLQQFTDLVLDGLLVPKDGREFEFWYSSNFTLSHPRYVSLTSGEDWMEFWPYFHSDLMVPFEIDTTSMDLNKQGIELMKKYGWSVEYRDHWMGNSFNIHIEGALPASTTLDEFKAIFNRDILQSNNHYAPFWRIQYGVLGQWMSYHGKISVDHLLSFDSGHQFFNKAFVDGYVVDEQGNPVSDLVVTVEISDPALESAQGIYITKCMKTDKNGHYILILPGGYDSIIYFGGDDNWDTNKEYIADNLYVKDAKSQSLPTVIARHFSKIQVVASGVNRPMIPRISFDCIDSAGNYCSYYATIYNDDNATILVPANVTGTINVHSSLYDFLESEAITTPHVEEKPLVVSRTLVPKDKNAIIQGKLYKDGVSVPNKKLYYFEESFEVSKIHELVTDENGAFNFETYAGLCGEFAVDLLGEETGDYLYCTKGIIEAQAGINYFDVHIPEYVGPEPEPEVENHDSIEDSLNNNRNASEAINKDDSMYDNTVQVESDNVSGNNIDEEALDDLIVEEEIDIASSIVTILLSIFIFPCII